MGRGWAAPHSGALTPEVTRDPGGLARPVAEPESRPPLGGNRGRGGRRAVAGPPHACAVATPAGDDSSLRQDRAAEVRAVSEALRGVLKHLVGPASPAVVLSARPVDRRDAQVNPLAGCVGGLRGAGVAHGVRGRLAGGAGAARGVRGRLAGCGGCRAPAGNGQLPGESVCLQRSSTAVTARSHQLWLRTTMVSGVKLQFRAQGLISPWAGRRRQLSLISPETPPFRG